MYFVGLQLGDLVKQGTSLGRTSDPSGRASKSGLQGWSAYSLFHQDPASAISVATLLLHTLKSFAPAERN